MGARTQEINAAASVPGLIDFKKPEPQKTNFAPRVGFAYSPDEKISIRAGFGMAYDVYYDNLGILSFPPQFSSTNDTNPTHPTMNFLANGGLPAGNGSLATFPTIADQRAANQHLFPARNSPMRKPGRWVCNAFLPNYLAAGFTSNITSYQPWSQSNYNGLSGSLIRRFQNGLQMNFAYTWSKAMDDATADVFSTVISPRRPQDSQNIAADYSRSALDHTNRFTAEVIYDTPFFKHSTWLLKNVASNWEIAPIYTYQSPEYATVQSGTDSNLNGDSAPDRVVVNQQGAHGTGSGVSALYSPARAFLCGNDDSGAPITQCSANLVGYAVANPNAYYITAGQGALARGGPHYVADPAYR